MRVFLVVGLGLWLGSGERASVWGQVSPPSPVAGVLGNAITPRTPAESSAPMDRSALFQPSPLFEPAPRTAPPVLDSYISAHDMGSPMPSGEHSTKGSEETQSQSSKAPTTSASLDGGTGDCGPDSCLSECYLPCEPCCPCPLWGRTWVSAEWLYWVTNGYRVPALVSTSPAGTQRIQSGVLTVPGSSVVFGDENLHAGDFRNGFRVQGGMWLDECETIGIEAGYFFLGDSQEGFSASSTGVPQLSRPFFNAATGQPDAELVAFPGVIEGTVSVLSDSSFSGANIGPRGLLCCGCAARLDWTAGYLFLNLDESLTISENLRATDPTGQARTAPLVPPGTVLNVQDRFRTLNEFHGGYIGLSGRVVRGRFWADVAGSIAFGVTDKLINIGGNTVVMVPGQAPVTRPGGFAALQSNSGNYQSDDFAVVPQTNVRLGYRVTDSLSTFVSYNFLYWSDVARPGDQIDPVINPTQIPPGTLQGPARPAFLNGSSDFWAQGIGVGMEFRY